MDLKSLKKEYKKLTESDSGATSDDEEVASTGASEGRGPEDSKGFKSGKPVGFQSIDNHSKPVQKVPRANGVQDAVKEFKPMNSEMKGTKFTVKSVNREQGVAAGVKEVGKGDKNIGTKEAAGKDTRVNRQEGATAGAQEVGEYGNMSAFRSKVRAAFGLPLDDKLNKGNNGLNNK